MPDANNTFNLNLLECKLLSFAVCSPTRFPFNLNLLECKSLSAFPYRPFLSSFNLNLLECKSRPADIIFDTNGLLISTYWNVNKVVRALTIPSLTSF